MTIDQADVSNENYTFKSNRIGADEITVYSDNPKFKLGIYHIAIEAFRGSSEHKIGVQIQVKEAKPVTLLTNEGDPLTATVHDCVFFKYVLQDTSDLERLFLLLNVSNRTRL